MCNLRVIFGVYLTKQMIMEFIQIEDPAYNEEDNECEYCGGDVHEDNIICDDCNQDIIDSLNKGL